MYPVAPVMRILVAGMVLAVILQMICISPCSWMVSADISACVWFDERITASCGRTAFYGIPDDYLAPSLIYASNILQIQNGIIIEKKSAIPLFETLFSHATKPVTFYRGQSCPLPAGLVNSCASLPVAVHLSSRGSAAKTFHPRPSTFHHNSLLDRAWRSHLC